MPFPSPSKILVVRNSGAGNDCANVAGRLNFLRSFCRHVHKFLFVFGGGGGIFFFGGGGGRGSADYIFMGAGDFSAFKPI